MAIEPAAISARPAVTMIPVVADARPVSPAASANGTVRPSDIPITMSRTVSPAVKCRSVCRVCGITVVSLAQVQRIFFHLSFDLPLPLGEGWGEGLSSEPPSCAPHPRPFSPKEKEGITQNFPLSTSTPMTMNATPAIRLIQSSGKYSLNTLPTMTPIAETNVSASEAAIKTSQGRFIVGSVLSEYLPLDWIKRIAGA